MKRYRLSFMLKCKGFSSKRISSLLSEFGEEVVVTPSRNEPSLDEGFYIEITCEEPTAIFEVCAKFGRLGCIKAEELGTENAPRGGI